MGGVCFFWVGSGLMMMEEKKKRIFFHLVFNTFCFEMIDIIDSGYGWCIYIDQN